MIHFKSSFRCYLQLVLGYLAKLKKGGWGWGGLAFGAHFLHDFSINVLCLGLYQWIEFQCHTLYHQDIRQNVKFLFRELMKS